MTGGVRVLEEERRERVERREGETEERKEGVDEEVWGGK